MKKLISLFIILSIIFSISTVSIAKITLNFIEVLTSPERTNLLNEIIADFESIYPDIQINLISPPYEQAEHKAILMLNTNQPLDIIEVRDHTLKQHVNNKKLVNLENFLESWINSKTLLPITLETARTIDNNAYIIPHGFYVNALFYRKDILNKLGIEQAPETVSELFEICQKITNPAKNQYGFCFRGKAGNYNLANIIISSFIDDIDRNNIYLKVDGKPYFNDSRAIEGLGLFVRLFEETSPKDAINWGFNEQVNAFISGITPFLVQQSDTIPLLDKMLGREKYMVAPQPIGPSGKVYIRYGFAGYAIPSYSEHKEEAWEFIKYLSSPEVNSYFCKNYGPIPIHSITYETHPHFSKEIYSAWKIMIDNPEKYVFAKLPIDSPKWPGWPQIHDSDMQSLLLGKMSVDEAANKWTEYWQ